MDLRQLFEQTATSIAALDRDELKRRIRNFRGRFKLDFTEDYLDHLNIDRGNDLFRRSVFHVLIERGSGHVEFLQLAVKSALADAELRGYPPAVSGVTTFHSPSTSFVG